MEHGTDTMLHTSTKINVLDNGTFLEQYQNITVPLKPQHNDVSGNNSYYTIVLVGLGLAIYCVLYIRRRRNKKKDEEKREEEYLSYYHSILPQSRIYGGAPPSDTNITNMAKVIKNQKASETSVSFGLANVAGLLLMEQFQVNNVDQDTNKENEVQSNLKEENTKIAELIKQLQNESEECTAEHITESESLFSDEQLTKIVELILLEQLQNEDKEIQEDKLETHVYPDQKTQDDLQDLTENQTNTYTNMPEALNLNNQTNAHSVKLENEIDTYHGKKVTEPQGRSELDNEQTKDPKEKVLETKECSPIEEGQLNHPRNIVLQQQDCSVTLHNVFTISNKLNKADRTLSQFPKSTAPNHFEDNLIPSLDLVPTSEMPIETNANLIQQWDRKFRTHLQKHKPTAVVFHDDCLTATWI